jgi:hypothetical protein
MPTPTRNEIRETLRPLLHQALDALLDDGPTSPQEARVVTAAFASLIRLARLRTPFEAVGTTVNDTIPCPPPVERAS